MVSQLSVQVNVRGLDHQVSNTFEIALRNIPEPAAVDDDALMTEDTSPLMRVIRIADAKAPIVSLIKIGTVKRNIDTDFDAAW